MGCADSKEKACRPREGKAGDSRTLQHEPTTLQAAGKAKSTDFSPCLSRSCVEEDDGSVGKSSLQTPDYGAPFVDDAQGMLTVEIASPPLRRDSDSATTHDGAPLTPPAASSLSLSTTAASMSPQRTQRTSSRKGAKVGVLASKTSDRGERRQCNKVATVRPLPLDDALPPGAVRSTAAIAYISPSSLPLQSSPVSAAQKTRLPWRPSPASMQSASDTLAAASLELRRGGSFNEGGSVLTSTPDDPCTTGTSFLQTSSSTQPPSLEATRLLPLQPVTLPVAQQLSPASATQPRLALTAEVQHDPQLASTGHYSSSGDPMTHRRDSAAASSACHSPCAEVSVPLGKSVNALVEMDSTIGTPAGGSYTSDRDAGASPLGKEIDGCRETSSGVISATLSTQSSQSLTAVRLHSRSDSLLLSTPGRHVKPNVVQRPPFRPPYDSTSPSLCTPTQQQTPPNTSAPATTAPANATVSTSCDAPDDVPLPQHPNLFSVPQASNTAGVGTANGHSNCGDGDVGGVPHPRSPMPKYANICGLGTYTNGEGLPTISASATTTGAEILSEARASRVDLGGRSTHDLASSSNGCLLSSMKYTDDSSGSLVGSRWNDRNSTCTPPPTNSEVFRQIRQPPKHVKSILRKSGGSIGIAHGPSIVNDYGDQTNTDHSCVLSSFVNGGGASGRYESIMSTPRILASSGTAGIGDGRVSVMSLSIDEQTPQTDFIVLRHTTRDIDCVSGCATPADVSPLLPGLRSLTHHGSPTGTRVVPHSNHSDSAGNSNASVVFGTSVENSNGFLADDGCSSGNAGTRITPLSLPVQRSSKLPCRHPPSPSTPGWPSPCPTRQCQSSGIDSGGDDNIAMTSNGETLALPPPWTETELPILPAPEIGASAACTSDEPPPDIMLASPPPKRVRVVI